MTREKTLVKNSMIISIGTFLPKLTSFITLPIITAELTQREFGTYDLITTLISFFLPLVTLQVQAAAFRFLIDHRNNIHKTKEVITNILAFIIPVSIISLIILFFVLSKISILIRLLICVYFFLDILVLTARQIVRGLAKNMLYSMSAVIESISNMVLIIAMLKLSNTGIIGLLFAMTFATFLGLMVLIIRGNIIKKFDITLLSKKKLKEIISYSWPLIPNVMSDWILRLSDRMVITLFLGLNATAVYAVANKIPSLLTLVQNTFTYAWQENASLASKDDDEDIYYTHMFDLMSRLLSGATAILIITTPILFKMLIKGEYQEAYKQMPILLMAMLFSIYSSFIGGIYVAHKRTKSMGITTVLAAFVNLVLDLCLIRYLGIYAASISTFLSYFVLSIYRMKDVLRYHKISYKIKTMSLYLLVLIIMSIICWFNNLYLNIFNAIIGVLFACVINKNIIRKTLRIILKRRRMIVR